MQMQDNWGSIIFIIFYLAVIWIFLGKIILENLKSNSFSEKAKVWKWVFIAYFLLGFGDLFHLGTRIFVFFAGLSPDSPLTNSLIGFGYILTGITMTYFYVAIFHSWASIYGKVYSSKRNVKLLTVLLYAFFIIRLGLMLLPFNRWFEGTSTVDFGFDFRIITALPIYGIGLTSVYLLFRDSKKELDEAQNFDEKMNKANNKASIWFVVSFATYSVTTFLVAIYPLTGLFMIPKTIAYLVAFYYHYTGILNRSAPLTQVGDA